MLFKKLCVNEVKSEIRSVVFVSLSWNFLGQNTLVGSLSLLQGIFPNPGIELGSPALQADSLPTELSGKPMCVKVFCKRQTIRL